MFHPGLPPRLTKTQKIEKERKKRLEDKKKKLKLEKKTNKPFCTYNCENLFKKPTFNILPYKTFHPRISISLMLTYSNPKAIYEFVERWQEAPFGTTPDKWKNGLDNFWSPELRDGIEDAVFEVLKHRFLFRKLLHHWRYRYLKKANKEDFVSLEVPKKPIYITDWALKSIWQFEATSLMKDITTRLLHHDGFFEDPQVPRNPYTNKPLTSSQTISIWNQLSLAGIPVSSPFTSYRAARYNLKRFIAEQNTYLQLYSLRQTMKSLETFDTYERMIDFIQYAYDQESVDCYIQAYAHALRKYPENPLIKMWQRLCTKFYEADIAFYNSLDKKAQIQNKVLDETVKLLDKQKILVSLRNEDLRNSVNVRGDIPFPPMPVRLSAPIPLSLLTHIVSELEFSFNL